jgi:rod shape-determining protein MreC
MLAVPSRHRSVALLGIVLLAQVLMLAVQIHNQQRHSRLIRVWVVDTLTPFERVGTWGVAKIRGTWRDYFALVHTRLEDQQLKSEMDQLKIRNTQLESEAAEAGRLAVLIGFRDAHTEAPMLAARVIASSADSSSQTFYINRCDRDGIRRNMAVITPDGVVGKILEVYGSTAEVLVITDKDSGVGALLAGSRVHGPVGGTGEPLMQMKYVSNDDNVAIGEQVLTSGEDRIFPKDLPVGAVASVKPGYPFKQITISPAAHLDRIEEVLVLLSQHELNLKPATPATSAASAAPAAPPKDNQ